MKKNYIWSLLFVLISLLSLSSCQDENEVISPVNTPGSITLSVTLPNVMPLNQKSRANVNSFNTITDLNVLVAKGNSLIQVFYFGTFTNQGDDPKMEVNGNTATITISQEKQIPADAEIFVLANRGEQVAVTTLDALKAIIDEEAVAVGKPQRCYMFAQAQDHRITNDKRYMKAELLRTVAMVTVVVDGSRLSRGVRIEPQKIALYQVPRYCTVGNNGANQAGPTNVIEEGDFAAVTHWGDLGTDQGLTAVVGSHDSNSNFYVPLFLYENMQPDGTGQDTDKNKKPAVGREEYCTYVEVEGYYTYTSPQGSTTITGTVKYRYYLGKDTETASNKFDVQRNHHYKLTLMLHDLGVTEGGQLNSDGTLNTQGQGNWRVETDLSDFNFTTSSTIVNGAGTYIALDVTAIAKEWTIVQDPKYMNSDIQFVWIYDDTGSYKQWIYAGGDWKVSGNKTIYLYAEALDPEQDLWKGKREMHLILKTLDGKEERPLTITQYTPLKIEMPEFDAQGQPTSNTKTFWVEAVDRVPMPWGYEDVSFVDQQTNGSSGMDNMHMLVENNQFKPYSLRYMPYGTNHGGSAMMQAAFNDLVPNLFQRPENNIHPETGMTPKLPTYTKNNERKYFYAVPSIAEWQFIEKNMQSLGIGPNASDINKRLNPGVEYWTSNHSVDYDNESYTYQIKRGLDTMKPDAYYSYRKNRVVPLRFRCILTKNPNYRGY